MPEAAAVLEWNGGPGNEISFGFPAEAQTGQLIGAKLIVRHHQAAVLVCDGRGLDVFGQGSFTLAAGNLPGFMKMRAFSSEAGDTCAGEIHFINLNPLTDRRWETAGPTAYRDSECGIIRFQAFGTYSVRIREPLLFLNTVAGTYGCFSAEQADRFLQSMIVSRVCDYLGDSVRSLCDLPGHYEAMQTAVGMRLADELAEHGAAFLGFSIARIVLSESVQKTIDERAGMKAVGDFERFFKHRPPKGLFKNEACAPAAGGPKGGEEGEASHTTACPVCGCAGCHDSRVCRSCGHYLLIVKKCVLCHASLSAEDQFCRMCGSPEDAVLLCPACDERLPHGARFCISCGEQVPDPS